MKREGRKKRFFFFAMKTSHSSSRLPFFFFFPVPWKQAWWNLLSPQRKHREKQKRTRSHYLSPRKEAKQQALLIYSKKEKTRIHQTFQKKKKKRSALKWGKPYFQHLVCLQLRRKLPWFSFLFFFFFFIGVFCYDRSSPCFVQREEKVNKKKKKKSSLWEVLSERGTGYDALHLIPFFTPRFLLSLWMSSYKIWTNAAMTKGK